MKVYRMTELLRVLACQRAYLHEYVERLESVAFQGIPQPVGTAIHKGVEVIYRGEPTATAVDMADEVYNKGWRESLKEPSAEEMDKIDEGLAQVKACVGGYAFRPTTEKVIELEGESIVPRYLCRICLCACAKSLSLTSRLRSPSGGCGRVGVPYGLAFVDQAGWVAPG